MTGAVGPTLRAELTKLISLRSVWITWVAAVVLPIAITAATSAEAGREIAGNDPRLAAGVVPDSIGLDYAALAVVGMAIIGVVAATSETSDGQIRVSLAAVPARGVLLSMKMLAVLACTSVAAVTTVVGSSLVGQVIISHSGVDTSGVSRSLVVLWIGAVVFLMGFAQIGLALGVLLRNGFVPIAILIVFTQGGVMFLTLTPWVKFLPSIAGYQLFDTGLFREEFPSASMAVPASYAVFGLWVLGLSACALWVFSRRDVRR